jgi:hypothetical protein
LNFHLATVFAIDAMSLGARDVCLVAWLNRASDSRCRRRARMQSCSAWFSRHPRFPESTCNHRQALKRRPHAGGRSLDDSSLILSDRRKSSLSAGGHAGFGLERVEVMADALEIGAVDLDGAREVIEREPGVERIDADDEEPRPLRLIVDRGATWAQAAAFSEDATESSMSRMSASAPQSLAHANLCSYSVSCGFI